MEGRPDPETVLDLFGDSYVRTIVKAASREPMSVKQLSDECDSALSTVYRRVDDLVDEGILVERTQIEQDGSHHGVYQTSLEVMTLRVDRGRFALEFEVTRDPAERFTTMWRDIRGA